MPRKQRDPQRSIGQQKVALRRCRAGAQFNVVWIFGSLVLLFSGWHFELHLFVWIVGVGSLLSGLVGFASFFSAGRAKAARISEIEEGVD